MHARPAGKDVWLRGPEAPAAPFSRSIEQLEHAWLCLCHKVTVASDVALMLVLPSNSVCVVPLMSRSKPDFGSNM